MTPGPGWQPSATFCSDSMWFHFLLALCGLVLSCIILLLECTQKCYFYNIYASLIMLAVWNMKSPLTSLMSNLLEIYQV